MTNFEFHVGLPDITQATGIVDELRAAGASWKQVTHTRHGPNATAALDGHGVDGCLRHIATYRCSTWTSLATFARVVRAALSNEPACRVEIERLLSRSSFDEETEAETSGSEPGDFQSLLGNLMEPVAAPRYEAHLKVRGLDIERTAQCLEGIPYFELTQFEKPHPEVIVTLVAGDLSGLRGAATVVAGALGNEARVEAPTFEAIEGCWKPAGVR